MPEEATTSPQTKNRTHLHGCAACAKHTRASAYIWFGKNHSIPALHGAGWLGEDLRRALETLELGQELELDYRSDTTHAPLIAVHRSLEDVITASGPDGWRHARGQTQWTWQPSNSPRRLQEITFTLLGFIKSQRGASGVILVPPRE